MFGVDFVVIQYIDFSFIICYHVLWYLAVVVATKKLCPHSDFPNL